MFEWIPVSRVLVLVGFVLFFSTLKRPIWLGGSKWRYDSEQTASAMLKRSGRRSLGMYLMGGGAIFWSMGF